MCTPSFLVSHELCAHAHSLEGTLLPTTALILCRSSHDEAPHATTSLGLAQGPYMVARVGFEHATEPPRPMANWLHKQSFDEQRVSYFN